MSNLETTFRGDLPGEDEADEIVTDMLVEFGLGEPPIEQRLHMRAAVLTITRLLLARGWRLERPQ